VTECPHCYAQVALDSLAGHHLWHTQQRQMMELTVKNLEGLANIVERLLKAQLPKGRV
jgi:hypothetical protein